MRLLEDGTAEITDYTGAGGDVVIPDTIDGYAVTGIGAWAFSSCHSLTAIEIPYSVIRIGEYAFRACDALTAITVAAENPNYFSDEYGVLFDKAKTTLIQYPIGNSRTEYTIPDSVTTIGAEAFGYCNSLTTIEISDSVTTIGDFAFEHCNALTAVKIGNSVSSIGYGAFSHCEALTIIEIPDSVTTIGDYAFCSCDTLTTVDIGNGVTTIGDGAFSWCVALAEIIVDSGNLNYSSDSFGVLFNKDKTELMQYPIGHVRTSYAIPDSVTIIGDESFGGCHFLTTIEIPDSATTIGYQAFFHCEALTTMTRGS